MIYEKFLFTVTFYCILFLQCKMIYGQGIIQQALYLGDTSNFNSTREDCVWKRGNDLYDKCPDPDINLYLYTSMNKSKELLDVYQGDWLRNSKWDPQKENIILIHGYAGNDEALPLIVLRDAYLKHGSYNVFMANWGALAKPPCYVSAVHNLKTVARCLAESYTFLRNSGLRVDKTTCVGHSLGAHICGLDPARPLIKPGNSNRLDSGDAKAVHVIHTNAGYYGETGRVGHVDFCVNGGKRQPYCSNTSNANLCSHIWAICYLAQSIHTDYEPHAEPCSRRCPSGLRRFTKRSLARYIVRNAIPMGQHTPMNAVGSYCLKDDIPPYCSTSSDVIGDKRCLRHNVIVSFILCNELVKVEMFTTVVASLITFYFICLQNTFGGVNITVGSCVIQYSEVCNSNFVRFYISSSDHRDKGFFLFENFRTKIPEWINFKNENKIIIHGYGGGIEYNQTKEIQEEYLKINSTNVIAVDWGRLVILPCYPSAAVNTKQAGECIATFLQNLQKINSEFEPNNVHIIGFSLGAHVAGFASNALEKSIGKKINRITALDPALPLFATSRASRKLDSSDAEFVDVIHTNLGIFGKIEPSGHVDFYINGGQFQPMCQKSNNIPLCSHMMAIIYFKESIAAIENEDDGFWGFRCSSYFQFLFGWCNSNSTIKNSDQILMGEHCSRTEHGIVFVYTNILPPYAMGKLT
ncbi:uncharacterized protein LOC129612195 [Condylostylus longicornis]|uniref:uncharacterized protein LOC129612195 n=1 Tax=Condylostylus longicornis TaxID=2530218 RepID=UPI00244DB3AD|nr:uncharacterized protein LOC129612195 [Condylostylus longicornis]